MPPKIQIGPSKPLPYSSAFNSADDYVDSLLSVIGTHQLLRTLCGGVHILDFFTSTPDLYSTLLPPEWIDWFEITDIFSILDLFMRDDLPTPMAQSSASASEWRNGPLPPPSLVTYIELVRKHSLDRTPAQSHCSRIARHVAVGMSVKKVHEVGLFASYLNQLCDSYSETHISPISHLVDFGSGQNYLGRALASEPFNRNIVAIESRQANADRAREFDVMAKLATKERILRNKKVFRETGVHIPVTPPPEVTLSAPPVEVAPGGTGRILYIDHRLQDGDLTDVISQIPDPTPSSRQEDERAHQQHQEKTLMVISLHSCGNLLHHGLRSLTLNPAVKIVALVGCCYNLLTERLGPATYKLPSLRPAAASHLLPESNDPNGFPMSQRFCNAYPASSPTSSSDEGVKLNITSRMMAVQAPSNWGESDSSTFFTRHFYRALLQRIFLDYGIVGPPQGAAGANSPAGHSSGGTPIIIGSLRKSCYANFPAYVRGALAKLMGNEEGGGDNVFREKMGGITDSEIRDYEERYARGKKSLSVIWSLMAFSAGVIEGAIVVDRWLWLREQEDLVGECWVEPVFEYRLSPRNLVVVGVKK